MMSVVLLLVLVSVLAVGAHGQSYDVCVVGGGASGSASAVFLKQLGYSVKVIEKNNTLGGHCNTVPFTAFGEQLWVDIGVQGYTNSSFANKNGLGTWAFDSAQFVSQFVPASLIHPFGVSPASSSASYYANFKTGQLLTETINATEFEIALNTLLGIVSQYPWLNTAERPDPVPAFMLEPFADFIAQHNLGVLVDNVMYSLVFASGYGSLSQMSTLQGLIGLSAINLMFVLNAPYCGFSILGGCHVLYEGIAAYLGDAVTYGATITELDRDTSFFSHEHPNAGAATISGYTLTSSGHKSHFSYQCGKTIIAIYPLLQNLLPWFDATPQEFFLFSNLVAQGYLTMATTFTEGSVAGQAFGISNFDPTQQYQLPQLPALSGFQRVLPVGPAAAFVNSQSSFTPACEMLDAAWEQFAGVPSSVISNIKISAWSLHQYAPHWTTRSQAQSPSPDTQLKNLQGQHGTYWVGSGVASEGSTVVWNHAYKLIQANFPPKRH